MNIKERLLSIHIRNKLAVHPDYARTFGIEVLSPLPRSNQKVQNFKNTSLPESTRT